MMAAVPPDVDDPLSARAVLRVRLDGPAHLRVRAAWALEALLARMRIADWVLAYDGQEADVAWGVDGVLPCDPAGWEFRWDAAPDVARDPLAFAFWWLAREEERLAPETAFDEHGRFRCDASAMSRLEQPLAAPVDELAADLAAAVFGAWQPEPDENEPAWRLVLTHDIDLPWRWTRAGRRRALRELRTSLVRLQLGAALRTACAIAAIPVWRLRGDDPFNNAWRIERLERREGARSTSYLLEGAHAPQDGAAELHERGRDYGAQLTMYDTLEGRGVTAGGRVALHGSYTSSVVAGRLAAERGLLEERLKRPVADHRFHYLRHRPVDAWPLLERAGIRTDASLGYAERPGFRAGTAHPFRGWDHGAGQPLDLVIIPLACMDASFDERYLNVRSRRLRAARVRQVVDAVRRYNGAASLLVHNDRLCNLTDDGWTRQYRHILRAIAESDGAGCTAADAAEAYRARLPASNAVSPVTTGRG